MFARIKKSGNYQYVQVVHNERIDGKVRQRVIATLGRLDVLKETGQLDQLLESLARLSDHAAVLHALKTNQITASSTVHLGPPLVFEKLWKQVGMPNILRRLLEGRRFEFPLERVVFITVLHRCSLPEVIGPRSVGVASMRWETLASWTCSTFIARWVGWASHCLTTNNHRTSRWVRDCGKT